MEKLKTETATPSDIKRSLDRLKSVPDMETAVNQKLNLAGLPDLETMSVDPAAFFGDEFSDQTPETRKGILELVERVISGGKEAVEDFVQVCKNL